MAVTSFSSLSTVEIVIQLGLALLSLACFVLFAVVWIRMLINVSGRRRPGTRVSKFKRSATIAFSMIFVSNLFHGVRFFLVLLHFPDDLDTSADFDPFEWNANRPGRSFLTVLDLSCILLGHFSLYLYFLLAVGRWFMYRSTLHFLSNIARALTIAGGTILYLLTFTSIVIVQLHPPPYSETEKVLVIVLRSAQTAFVLAYDDTISVLLCKASFEFLDRPSPNGMVPVVRQTDLRDKVVEVPTNRDGGVASESDTEFTLIGTENPNLKRTSTLPADPFGRRDGHHFGRPSSYSAAGSSTSYSNVNPRLSRIPPAASASTTPVPTLSYTPSLQPSHPGPRSLHTKRSINSLRSAKPRAAPLFLLSTMLLVDLALVFINLAPQYLSSFQKYAAGLEFLFSTAIGVHIAISAFLMIAFSKVVHNATTHLSTQPNSVHAVAMDDCEDDDGEVSDGVELGSVRQRPLV